MAELDEWTDAVMAELDVPADAYDRNALLDLTRDVAHGVARPAAPLTAYLAGVAVGRGASVEEAVAAVQRLLAARPEG